MKAGWIVSAALLALLLIVAVLAGAVDNERKALSEQLAQAKASARYFHGQAIKFEEQARDEIEAMEGVHNLQVFELQSALDACRKSK
jgi:hypothetical protein